MHRLDARSDRLQALGAEVVAGDLRDRACVIAAMVGIRRAFFGYPVKEGLLEAAATSAAAARTAASSANRSSTVFQMASGTRTSVFVMRLVLRSIGRDRQSW